MIEPLDTCNHVWTLIRDWEGDPTVPRGTRDTSFWQCRLCGEETYQRPANVDND